MVHDLGYLFSGHAATKVDSAGLTQISDLKLELELELEFMCGKWLTGGGRCFALHSQARTGNRYGTE